MMKLTLLAILLSAAVSGPYSSAMPTIIEGCEIYLGKPQLERINGPFQQILRDKAAPWADVSISIEWNQTDAPGRRSIVLTPDSEGNYTIPAINPITLDRGHFAVVARAWQTPEKTRSDLRTAGGVFYLKHSQSPSLPFFLSYTDELYAAQDPDLRLSVLATALTAVPYIRAFQYVIRIRRENLLDVTDMHSPDDLTDLQSLERDLGDAVHRQNAKTKEIFNRILELKAKGLDDLTVVDDLGLTTENHVPLEIGDFRMQRVKITSQSGNSSGPARLFENDDVIAIQFIYMRTPPGGH